MASEYYKKKFQDVKKDEVIELTPKEKRINWWHYHWHYVLIAVLAVIGVVLVLKQFVFVVHPDYKVMVIGDIGAVNLDSEVLEQRLTEFGEDANGDGKVIVNVRSFMISGEVQSTNEEMIAISGDIGGGNCQIFILQDLEWFNGRFGIIEEGNYYKISQCPALQALGLDGDYYIAIRSYGAEKQAKSNAHAQVLWEALTAGAE